MAASFTVMAFCHGLFILLLARTVHVHYERYSLKEHGTKMSGKQLLEQLQGTEILDHLTSLGIQLSPEDMLSLGGGSTNTDSNGYDAEEKILAQFDEEYQSKKTSLKAARKALERALKPLKAWNGNANMRRETYSLLQDLFYLVGGYAISWIVVHEKQALRKKVTESSLFFGVRMAHMNHKWKRLEAEKTAAEERIRVLSAQKEKLERSLDSENVRTQEEKDTLKKTLASVEDKLECEIQKQQDKDEAMKIERSRSQRCMDDAHRSNVLVAAIMHETCGHFEAKYEEHGATQGFGSVIETNGFNVMRESDETFESAAVANLESVRALKVEKESPREIFGYNSVVGGWKLFEVDGLIASGLVGAYKCHDFATKEQHCVKIYPIADAKAQKRACVLRELQAKRDIGTHKHIVSFRHAVETKDKIYVMMEYIDGKDLLMLINKRGCLPEKEAAAIFWQLCQALKFCHDKHIVHGDVKPENVVVSTAPEEPLAKLIDFGAASYEGTNENCCVRDALAAPEAFEPKGHNRAKGDVFRLGGTLYMMLCGLRPFDDIYVQQGDERRFCKANLDKRKAGEVKKGEAAYKKLSAGAKELLDKMLKDRITLRQAMSHKWIKENVPEAADTTHNEESPPQSGAAAADTTHNEESPPQSRAAVKERTPLESMTQAQLKDLAQKMKIPAEDIDACYDECCTKTAMIELILNRQVKERTRLESMNQKGLKDLAKEMKIPAEYIDACYGECCTKTAMIELILNRQGIVKDGP